MKWPGAIETRFAEDYTMIGNSIAGSEKVGLITGGVPCEDNNALLRVRDNEVINGHLYKISSKYITIGIHPS